MLFRITVVQKVVRLSPIRSPYSESKDYHYKKKHWLVVINNHQKVAISLKMEKSHINLAEVGVKAQSKSEIYRALVVEGSLYLPPQKEASMMFISQIAIGEKKVSALHSIHYILLLQALKSKDVIVCTVPHVNGLRSEDFINFLINKWNANEYLPDNWVKYVPNRSWLANLCECNLFYLTYRKFSR